MQIIFEKFNKKNKRRRSLIQPYLTFDIYFRNLKKFKPDFSNFFTNHLAGMMHYYWLDIFPSDFKNPYRAPDHFNKDSVIKALDIADSQIGLLMKFARKNSYQFWIASSMGQEAIQRVEFERIFIRDFKKILNICNLNKTHYKLLPSMYPDINIESYDEKSLDKLIKNFLEIKFHDNVKSIFKIRYKKNINKINLIFNVNLEKKDYLYYKNKKINIKDFGLDYGTNEQGTGYHIPEGVLLMQGKKSQILFDNLTNIDTKNIFSYILKLYKK